MDAKGRLLLKSRHSGAFCVQQYGCPRGAIENIYILKKSEYSQALFAEEWLFTD